MTDAELWKAINETPAEGLLDAMKKIGEMMRAGATPEQIDAFRKACVQAWVVREQGEADA